MTDSNCNVEKSKPEQPRKSMLVKVYLTRSHRELKTKVSMKKVQKNRLLLIAIKIYGEPSSLQCGPEK